MPPKKKDKAGKKGKKGKKSPPKTPSIVEIVEPEKPPVRKISTPKTVSCTNKVTADSKPCPSECNCYQPLDLTDPDYSRRQEFIYGGPFCEPKILKTPSACEKENEIIKALDLFKSRKHLVKRIAPPNKPKRNCQCIHNKGTCICDPIQRNYY